MEFATDTFWDHQGKLCVSTVRRIMLVLSKEVFCSWLYDWHIWENTMIPQCKLALHEQGNQGPFKAVCCVRISMEEDLNLVYGFWAYEEELPEREGCLILDLITRASSGSTFPQSFITGCSWATRPHFCSLAADVLCLNHPRQRDCSYEISIGRKLP